MNESEKQQASVPYFVHEGDMMHLEANTREAMDKMKAANKNILSALLIVCVTLIIVVVLFVVGYTINNRNWIKYAERLQTMYTSEDYDDAGVLQQPDQVAD